MHARFLRDFFLFERTKHGLWLHGNMDSKDDVEWMKQTRRATPTW